jgi:DNA repair ATPase RecN
MEMKCIFNIGKNISTLAKVTQVIDVAHGPLV